MAANGWSGQRRLEQGPTDSPARLARGIEADCGYGARGFRDKNIVSRLRVYLAHWICGVVRQALFLGRTGERDLTASGSLAARAQDTSIDANPKMPSAASTWRLYLSGIPTLADSDAVSAACRAELLELVVRRKTPAQGSRRQANACGRSRPG